MDDFALIYIDSILVYSKIMQEHIQQLEKVFGKLKDNNMYANEKNNDFSQ